MRHFARSHRCVTYSQRGYPPSDVPEDPSKYTQDLFRDDVIAVMDALKIDKAHVVGHSMGASTALHVGIRYPKRCISVTAAGCGYGSSADPKVVEESRAASRETAKMFAENTMADAAAKYGDGPTRQAHKNKDPRGYAHFVKMLSEHSPLGHSLTMVNLQAKRPTLWDMQADLKKFSLPLLIVVGDEDDLVSRRQRVPAAHRADRRPRRRAAHRSYAHERGAGEIQRRARRVLRRRRSEAPGSRTSRASRSAVVNQGECDGPSAQRQDRAGDRRQRGHRQGHRAGAGEGRRRRRDLRAPQGAARAGGGRDRQGDQPQDRRRSSPISPRTPTPRTSSSRATRRSAASTSWSTMRAPRRAA